ncbi:MAG: PilZ domain-containing protein [Devosiaceae bacterium]|nr:PilZ domain-containing protein [Devosiaceae bacterium MH13]
MTPEQAADLGGLPPSHEVYRSKGGGFSLRSLIPRFGEKKSFSRRHRRYPCCVIASMDIVERAYSLDGTVLEMSQGGLMFRAASNYVLDRTGEKVVVHIDGLDLPAQVMASRPEGYGLRLLEDLDLTTVSSLVEEFGMDELAGDEELD